MANILHGSARTTPRVRPNFMKIAPIIQAVTSRKAQGGALRYRLGRTGQHYDARMPGDFFKKLGIREPDINLASGSGIQAEQTAAIMTGYEALLLRAPTRHGPFRT